MNNLKVLIADDDGSLEEAVRDLYEDEMDRHLFISTDGLEETLEAIVMEVPDICLVADPQGEGNSLDLISGLNEAGLRTPVIAVVSPEKAGFEDEFVARGGKGVILRDGSLGLVLRYFIRYASEMKANEDTLRREKENLIEQLFDLQDSRDRAEQQSINLVELAEDLSIAKETLELLNTEKDKFFSIIAHDLRGPFNTILGYTELLAHSAPNLSTDQVATYATNAHTSAKRVFDLLENLLEWARLQMDRMDYRPSTTDLHRLADKTVDLFKPMADEKGVTIESRIEDETAFIDQVMIDTVIRNLVGNAAKFTDTGGRITIAAGDAGDFLEISIADTGVGMEPERAAKVFSMADNQSTSGTNGEPGTGLGLLLCKELVEQNGGKISVQSLPGQGSVFSFTVPRGQPGA